MTCPSSLELSRAISDGADAALAAHVAGCASCTAEWNATLDMLALARELGAPLPSSAHREEVRTTMLAASRLVPRAAPSAAARSPRTRRLAAAALAAAAAVAAVIALVAMRADATTPAHVHASVRALDGARYLAPFRSPDEVVFLYDGAIDVEVSPLHPRERFRVVIGTDEVEVHGTQFVVTARAGVLVSVEVGHGVVEVRPRTGGSHVMRAGERWQSPTAPRTAIDAEARTPPTSAATANPSTASSTFASSSAPSASTASPSTARTPTASTSAPSASTASTSMASPLAASASTRRASTASTSPARASTAHSTTDARVTSSRDSTRTPGDGERAVETLPQERAYDDAWASMRTSRFSEAATAFFRVQILDPDGPLAEDATYWYAVALARGKQSAQARSAFGDFLERYPRSRRAGEASTMLGWLLVDAKQLADAERRFRAAIGDPNAAVRKSAQAGLDAVTKPR